MSPDDKKIQEMFNMLLETGAIEVTGVDREGNLVYRFTDRCQELFPELYELHKSEIDEMARELWNMGLVEIIFRDEDTAIAFTAENYTQYRKLKDQLNEDQIHFLEVIVGQSLDGLDLDF